MKKQKVKRIKHIPNCDYCGNPAKLVTSDVIYNNGDKSRHYWYCKDCDAWVGTHINSHRYAPYGSMANAELRQWRKNAHYWFDIL